MYDNSNPKNLIRHTLNHLNFSTKKKKKGTRKGSKSIKYIHIEQNPYIKIHNHAHRERERLTDSQ
jgi:Icc-related predicted phosphoesterase